jgi:hypothetical protein
MIKTTIEILKHMPDGTMRVIAKMEQTDVSRETKYEARIKTVPPLKPEPA